MSYFFCSRVVAALAEENNRRTVDRNGFIYCHVEFGACLRYTNSGRTFPAAAGAAVISVISHHKFLAFWEGIRK